uniref:hypothetical protein n=1 Tax=Salmonella enterica TaxID=28901 RepID=UPI0020C3E1FE
QNAIIKEDSSEISSYVSPYEEFDDETASRVLVVPPLTTILPSGELQATPSQPLLTVPPPEGPSSSSPPIKGKVIAIACPKVWRVI